ELALSPHLVVLFRTQAIVLVRSVFSIRGSDFDFAGLASGSGFAWMRPEGFTGRRLAQRKGFCWTGGCLRGTVAAKRVAAADRPPTLPPRRPAPGARPAA